jgi:hypothetical protein
MERRGEMFKIFQFIIAFMILSSDIYASFEERNNRENINNPGLWTIELLGEMNRGHQSNQQPINNPYRFTWCVAFCKGFYYGNLHEVGDCYGKNKSQLGFKIGQQPFAAEFDADLPICRFKSEALKESVVAFCFNQKGFGKEELEQSLEGMLFNSPSHIYEGLDFRIEAHARLGVYEFKYNSDSKIFSLTNDLAEQEARVTNQTVNFNNGITVKLPANWEVSHEILPILFKVKCNTNSQKYVTMSVARRSPTCRGWSAASSIVLAKTTLSNSVS